LKILCPELPGFDIGNRDAIRTAFADAPALEMQQGWLEQPEKHFLAGRVRIGWRDDRFLIFGELTHTQLFTQSTEDNQILCNLGDAFEIFLRDPDGESYIEFHVAPNGRRLQLLWPGQATIWQIANKELPLENLAVKEPLFDFSQWVKDKIWCICASVPSSAFLPVGTSLESRTWLASFSRYDYSSAGDPPILSSTSPHAELSFHRQQEWAEVIFAQQ
jgi:hypothetical protein